MKYIHRLMATAIIAIFTLTVPIETGGELSPPFTTFLEVSELSKQIEKEKPKVEKVQIKKNFKVKASRSNPRHREIQVVATAYVANCNGCTGITKNGTDVRHQTPNIVAVDPNVIPLNSKVEINGEIYIAGDIGGGIRNHEIDILVATESEALEWGRRKINIKILD